MSEEPRLKAKLWVQAAVRTCSSQGVTATIARRGDADAGAVLIKQNLLGGGFRVLTQFRQQDGSPAWLKGTGPEPVDEAAAEAYIARQADRDSDIWVIEIDDKEGRLPFGGTVI
jgi:GMP synthase (glutamine-hydrolysing)